MIYNFIVRKHWAGNHIFWVAKSLKLKGCVGQGDTAEEAIEELEANEAAWLDAANEFDILSAEEDDDVDYDYDEYIYNDY